MRKRITTLRAMEYWGRRNKCPLCWQLSPELSKVPSAESGVGKNKALHAPPTTSLFFFSSNLRLYDSFPSPLFSPWLATMDAELPLLKIQSCQCSPHSHACFACCQDVCPSNFCLPILFSGDLFSAGSLLNHPYVPPPHPTHQRSNRSKNGTELNLRETTRKQRGISW